MKFGGGPDNWAGNCMGDCTGLCETCALRRTRADLAEAVALLREHRPGMCLCGHGESCSVCSRPPKAYTLDAKVAAFLARVDAR